jgi:hypothetical protein
MIPESGIKRFNVPAKGRTTLNEFQKRENVLEFQLACKRIGLPSSFGTVELNEWKLSSVVPCLIQLARIVQKNRKAALLKSNVTESSIATSDLESESAMLNTEEEEDEEEGEYSESELDEGVDDQEQQNQSLVMSFSEKELLTLQLLFLMLDRDDDGRITVQDLMALSEQVSQ